MEWALDGVTFDITVCQPGTHVGAVAVRGIDPVIDHEERNGAPRCLHWLRQLRVEVIGGENVVPFVIHGATVRHACFGRMPWARARDS